MRKTCFYLLAALFLLPASQLQAQKKKPRIAVFSFENKSTSGISWWTGQGAGEGLGDMLVTELVKTKNYTVIERDKINAIMAEQNMGQSGRITQQTAAQLGKLLGVEIAVFGAVTEFGHSRGGVGGRVKGIGVGVDKQQVTVAIDVRLVDTNTGEILAADAVRRDKSKRGFGFRKVNLSFNSRNKFDGSLIGKASRECVEDVIKMIDDHSGFAPWEGKIVKADGKKVIINAGSQAGIDVGDVLIVVRKGEALIDPDTGLSLGAEDEVVGKIKVTKNSIGGGKASECKVVKGKGFERGDVVRQE